MGGGADGVHTAVVELVGFHDALSLPLHILTQNCCLYSGIVDNPRFNSEEKSRLLLVL